ncbi:hypothetical protein C6558_37340 [Ensifer sp. NM-2]|nr:hypothetical protein C6558_37340 [Ensifer sp. NM-2]
MITSAVQSGSVTEIADGVAGENATTHAQNGAVTFADVDTLDTHSAGFTAQGPSYLGTFSLGPLNQAGDSVGWSFEVADGVLDSLQAGQTLTQKYDVTVDDGHGGTAVQTVTITITGTNDAPVITSAVQSGSVTEIADGVAGENATTHAQNGAVTFADVDTLDTHSAGFTAQGPSYLGTFSLGPLNQAGDSVGWSFEVADGVLDSLQAGQTLTQKYDVTVDDGHGGTAVQTVTIVITGTNDVPVITSAVQSGSVTEIADNAAGENATTHAQNGAVTFADVDTLDTHSAGFTAQGPSYLGTFSLGPLNQAGDSVGWSFEVADGVLDSLQAGQTLTQKYDVTVDDGHGGTAVQTVTIVITGTNDVPVITSAVQSGSVTEIADNAAGENATTHAQNGAVTFADVDTLDTHSAGFVPQGGGYLGTFALGALNQAGDSVGWSFEVADGVLDSLQAGQMLTQKYDVTVDDGHGGTAVQTVTITITGTNDVPVITSAVQSGSVTEIADGAAGENATTHAQNGAVTFADVDTLDTHSAGFTAQGPSYLGTFSLGAVNQATDTVGWSFQVADGVLDSLQAGQTLTQKYDVTVDDGHGGTAVQTVTITITGTNDVPVITSAVQSGAVTERADNAVGENAVVHVQGGAVTFADVDTLDTHSAGFTAQGPSYLGTFALGVLNQATDTVGWSFQVADGVLDSLQAGQTLTQKYDVTVDDGPGGTAVQTVTITITGTNDIPVITSAVQSGAVTEIADNVAGENATTHAQNGAVTFADVDTLDTHSAGFTAQGPSYLGTFSLGAVNQATDTVGWSFQVADGVLDSLQAGQTLTQKYDVTVDDGHGGTATQTVTVVITGTNDAPVITSGTQSATVTEIADGAAGENATTHAKSGAVSFADVDTLDTHSATFTAQGASYLGSFSLGALNQASDSVGWTFQVADSVLDSLNGGETLTQKYDVTVDDGHGGTATQTVTITITGTNDGVSVNGLSSSTEVTMYEKNLPDGSSPNAAALTQTGSFSVTTPDGLAGLTVNGTAVVTAGVFTANQTVDTALGLLTITGYTPTTVNGVVTGATFTYSYLLQDNSTGHTSAGPDGGVFDNFTVAVTDEDGSSTSAVLNVEITDDTPSAIDPDHLHLTNKAGTEAIAYLDADRNVDDNVGADQGGTVRFASSLNGSNSGFTSSGAAIYYYVVGNTLIASTSSTSAADNTKWVFEVEINQDGSLAGSNDSYGVTMYGKVDSASNVNFNGGSYAFSGGNTNWVGFVPNGQINSPQNDDSPDLLITPIGDDAKRINGTANSVGVSGGDGGQKIGSDEGVRLNFVSDLTGTPTATNYNSVSPGHTFDEHYLVNGASVKFGSIGNGRSTAVFVASDDNDFGDASEDNRINDSTPEPITRVIISHSGNNANPSDNTFVVDFSTGNTQSITVDGLSYRITRNLLTNEVKVEGLVDNTTVAVYTADQYTTLDVYYGTGSDTFANADDSFALTGFGSAVVATDPVSISIPVELVDADGDKAGGASIDLTFEPDGQAMAGSASDEVFAATSHADSFNGAGGMDMVSYQSASAGVVASLAAPAANSGDAAGDGYTAIEGLVGSSYNDVLTGDSLGNTLIGDSGSDALYGNSGNDILVGGTGDDFLYGGTGSDTMTGGSGKDTFVVDLDSLQLGIDDVITDYNYAENDNVDLSALLGNLPTGTNLDGNYVQVVQDGQNANLQVDTDGSAGNGAAWHTVAVLEDFQVSTEVVKVLFNENGAPKTQDVP